MKFTIRHPSSCGIAEANCRAFYAQRVTIDPNDRAMFAPAAKRCLQSLQLQKNFHTASLRGVFLILELFVRCEIFDARCLRAISRYAAMLVFLFFTAICWIARE